VKNRWRLVLRIVVLIATLTAFTVYLWEHPELLTQLGRIPPWVLAVLLVLYMAWFGALALTVQATLRLCRAPIAAGELGLLTAYSTMVNFFVPGQSGLIVRGLYMKKQHGLSVKRYLLASLLYYACYAFVSALMLLAASRPWWQTLVGLALAALAGFAVMRWYESRVQDSATGLEHNMRNFGFLLFATLTQACVQVAVYGFELHTVNPRLRLWQIVTYTGAANFSLFVALTPGAIGIRESFLYLSKQLHHVSTANIVAASVIDRVVFLMLLGLMFVVTIAFHAKRALKID
jgi:uncharacterized membrane protein YbhN (UPF0104 family)